MQSLFEMLKLLMLLDSDVVKLSLLQYFFFPKLFIFDKFCLVMKFIAVPEKS